MNIDVQLIINTSTQYFDFLLQFASSEEGELFWISLSNLRHPAPGFSQNKKLSQWLHRCLASAGLVNSPTFSKTLKTMKIVHSHRLCTNWYKRIMLLTCILLFFFSSRRILYTHLLQIKHWYYNKFIAMHLNQTFLQSESFSYIQAKLLHSSSLSITGYMVRGANKQPPFKCWLLLGETRISIKSNWSCMLYEIYEW